MHVCLYTTCAQMPAEASKGRWFSGTKVTESCEVPDMGSGADLGFSVRIAIASDC